MVDDGYTGCWLHFKGDRLTDPLELLINLTDLCGLQLKETTIFIVDYQCFSNS